MVELREIQNKVNDDGTIVDITLNAIDDGRGIQVEITVDLVVKLIAAAKNGYPTVDGTPITFTQYEGGIHLDTITLGKYVLKQTERSMLKRDVQGVWDAKGVVERRFARPRDELDYVMEFEVIAGIESTS